MSAAHLQVWLWAFPIATGIHVFEEFAWPGGLIRWIAAHNPRRPKPTRCYGARNGVAILGAMLIAAFALSGCSGPRLEHGMPVRDGFETTTLGRLWETDKIVPADVKLQSAVVRSGHSALQITLHTSDVFERGRHGKADSERAELTEADALVSRQGKRYAYAFSLFLPADFPIVDKRLVLAQWKQQCPRGRACDDDSPVLAIRYVSGVLLITQTIGEHRTTLWRTGDDVRGRWLDFRFRVSFDPSERGRIEAILNDTLVVDHEGPTAYQEGPSTGYPMPSRFYFKMGLYRDTSPEPMTLFIDDYSKELLDDE